MTTTGDFPIVPAPIEWLSAPEVAKLIRKDLKAAFPGVKFTVRSDRFAGGSSVDVGWTDGPLAKAVDEVVDRYKAQGFDGSTDSTTNRGPVTLADGRVVRISAWVSAQRSHSEALQSRVKAWVARNYAQPGNYFWPSLSRATLVGSVLVVLNDGWR
jgi:hypothetical protein